MKAKDEISSSTLISYRWTCGRKSAGKNSVID